MNKKGFTLIELLAVIVILGVIMLIAVPAVTGIISNSRKDSFVRSAEGYVDAAMKALATGSILPPSQGQSITVPIRDLEMQSSSHKSTYGVSLDTANSYVRITNTGTGDKIFYEYEVTLIDDNKNCIPLTKLAELNRNKVTTCN